MERTLIVLGICLPIPLLAATGLSLPLPSTVERIAASLVPWAAADLDQNQALPAGTSGSIVRVAGEKTVAHVVVSAPSAAANPRSEAPPASATGGKSPHGSTTGGGTSGAGGGTSGAGAGDGSQTPTGSEQPSGGDGSTTSPLGGTVDQVTDTTQPVVDQVNGTVDDVVDTAGETVDGLLSGLGK